VRAILRAYQLKSTAGCPNGGQASASEGLPDLFTMRIYVFMILTYRRLNHSLPPPQDLTPNNTCGSMTNCFGDPSIEVGVPLRCLIQRDHCRIDSPSRCVCGRKESPSSWAPAHLLFFAQSMIDEMFHHGFDVRGGDAAPRRPLFREIREASRFPHALFALTQVAAIGAWGQAGDPAKRRAESARVTVSDGKANVGHGGGALR